ncbi:DUF2971 domain-containing protein [Dyella subtropica]|uniref:DUF2971 domain-containing protein n=1 Tax=Dyella subtropica TaxID=2992127 RepID=UPI00225BADCB|nr:DUF2971 domain-containing protein [Dyella subtropica]
MRLYHFLEAKWALDDIRYRRLKVSHLDKLNDPFEFFAVDLSDKVFRRALIRTRDKLAANRGIICFCNNWRNPLMWAHYGDRYKGICLGFDVIAPEGAIAKIDYVERRLKRPRDFLAQTEADKLAFLQRLITTKFHHWQYEGEHRLYVSLDTNDPNTGQYFFDFGKQLVLREVIVGAESDTTRKQVRDALGSLAPTVEAFKSRPGFSNFEVVRNQDRSAWK